VKLVDMAWFWNSSHYTISCSLSIGLVWPGGSPTVVMDTNKILRYSRAELSEKMRAGTGQVGLASSWYVPNLKLNQMYQKS